MAGALLAVLFIFSAFTAARPLQAEDSGDKIIIAGAPSLIPLVERFTAQYRKEHPAMEIEIRGGGSNYAARAVRLGQIDVGLVTRNLDPAEQAEFLPIKSPLIIPHTPADKPEKTEETVL